MLASVQAMTRVVLDAVYGFAFAVCRDPGKKHLQVSLSAAVGMTVAGCAVCSCVCCKRE
jgi:hypothetical protein